MLSYLPHFHSYLFKFLHNIHSLHLPLKSHLCLPRHTGGLGSFPQVLSEGSPHRTRKVRLARRDLLRLFSVRCHYTRTLSPPRHTSLVSKDWEVHHRTRLIHLHLNVVWLPSTDDTYRSPLPVPKDDDGSTDSIFTGTEPCGYRVSLSPVSHTR